MTNSQTLVDLKFFDLNTFSGCKETKNDEDIISYARVTLPSSAYSPILLAGLAQTGLPLT
jgi:hypothetical protein